MVSTEEGVVEVEVGGHLPMLIEDVQEPLHRFGVVTVVAAEDSWVVAACGAG